jgi:hypothetical protein
MIVALIFAAMRHKLHGERITKNQILSILVVLLFSFGFSFMPQISPNSSSSLTWKYWHSANNDIFDGLCGAKAILGEEGNSLSIEDQQLIRERAPEAWEQVGNRFSESWICGNSAEVYTKTEYAVQYTSLALIANFTNSPPSMFTFLFQSVLNLFLFFWALLILGTQYFGLGKKHSFVFAFSAVFSHVYWTTFINGHIGTMMIAAPVVYFIFIVKNGKFNKTESPHFLLFALSSIFILLTYPFVFPILMIYAVGLFAISRLPRRFYNRLLFIAVAILIFLLWIYFQDARLKAASSFRSWGSFMTPLAPLQYFGVIPGNIMDSTLLGFFQNLSQQYSINSTASISFISVLILFPIILTLFRSFRLSKPGMNFSLGFSLIFPILILITSQDPYYFYKTSYIFQFIVIGFIFRGLFSYNQNLTVKKRSLMRFMSFYLIGILALNVSYNFYSSIRMIERNQKWIEVVNQIDEVPEKKMLQLVSLQEEGALDYISSFYLSNFRQALIENDEKKYSFYIDSSGDSYSVVINELKANTFRIANSGIFAPERELNDQFRWVAGDVDESNARTTSIRVINLSPGQDLSVRIFCTSLADFVDVEAVNYRFVDQDGNIFSSGLIKRDRLCDTIEVPATVRWMKIQVDAVGSFPSFFDRRRLLYKIWKIEGDREVSIF